MLPSNGVPLAVTTCDVAVAFQVFLLSLGGAWVQVGAKSRLTGEWGGVLNVFGSPTGCVTKLPDTSNLVCGGGVVQ